MKSGRDDYDQSLLDSLEKRYHLFLDSPNGEINVYLVLSKNDEDSKSEISIKTQNNNQMGFNENIQNMQNSSSNQRQTPLQQLQQNRSFKNNPKNFTSDNDIINNFS